jgi:hypothetical protein
MSLNDYVDILFKLVILGVLLVGLCGCLVVVVILATLPPV